MPERYSQYESILENVKFENICIRSNGNVEPILQYPTNKYITREHILLKVFNLTGILMPYKSGCTESGCNENNYKLDFIHSIITNKDNLDDCYLQIINEYLSKNDIYISGCKIGIPENHLRIVLGYHVFINILSKLADKQIPYKFNLERYLENHKSEIEQINDKSLKLSIFFKINNPLLLPPFILAYLLYS